MTSCQSVVVCCPENAIGKQRERERERERERKRERERERERGEGERERGGGAEKGEQQTVSLICTQIQTNREVCGMGWIIMIRSSFSDQFSFHLLPIVLYIDVIRFKGHRCGRLSICLSTTNLIFFLCSPGTKPAILPLPPSPAWAHRCCVTTVRHGGISCTERKPASPASTAFHCCADMTAMLRRQTEK